MSLRNMAVILVVAIGVFVVNLDVSITNIATPSLMSYFKVGTVDAAKIVLAYLLSLSGFLMVFGKLCDDFGPKNIFNAGVIVFMLASALCAFSNSVIFLIVSRFLQGAGGAMISASYGVVVMRYLPPDISGRAFGLVTAAGGVGFALGAPIGGYIIEHTDWRWIFMVNVPVCLLTLIVSALALGVGRGGHVENAAVSSKFKFDLSGAVYCFIFLAAFIYAVNQGKIEGWGSARIVSCYAATALFLALFVLRERKIDYPILDFALLKNAGMMCGYAATIAVVVTLDGTNFLFPLFFEFVKGLTPAETGRMLMIFPLLSLFVSPFAGYFSDKKGPAAVCRLSLALTVAACAMFCAFGVATGLSFIACAFVVYGMGLAFFFPSATALVMGHAPEGREGMAMALYSSVVNLGSILGIATFESIFAEFGAGGAQTLMKPAGVASGFNAVAIFALAVCGLGFVATLLAREKSRQIA